MSAMQGAISAAERSMRSVFVGNIPYEATEEQLKDIFSEVGPVVSFRLVYDRETGKPKGYGFCEYKDQEMALSAMRNLNGYELNGRALRVDNAASEKSKEELKNLQASLGGPPVESPYGPEVGPEKAPEEISKAVASLPPEQMFELMKQMKMCIQNNPNEARNLLLQNPQLAYALLQAQVIMRIVDPHVALSILHRQSATSVSSLLTAPDTEPIQTTAAVPAPVKNVNAVPVANTAPYSNPIGPTNEVFPIVSSAAISAPAMPMQVNPAMVNARAAVPLPRPSLLGDRPPPSLPEPPRPMMPLSGYPGRGPDLYDSYTDPRLGDRDMRQPPLGDHDMRAPPPPSVLLGDKDMRQAMGDQDLRHLPVPNPTPTTTAAAAAAAAAATAPDNRPFDPRYRNMPGSEPMGRGVPPFDRPRPAAPFDPRTAYEGRTAVSNAPRVEDPRSAQVPSNVGAMPAPPRFQANARIPSGGSPAVAQASPNAGASPRPNPALAAAAAAIAPHDQEKAALIMQVLQLSDQQIALLPPEQRQSIMILKDQIARNQQQQR